MNAVPDVQPNAAIPSFVYNSTLNNTNLAVAGAGTTANAGNAGNAGSVHMPMPIPSYALQ